MANSITASQQFELINAKYKLTELEIKFILFALTKIDSKTDTDLTEYEIKISELEDNMLFSKENDSRLKKLARSLLSKPLELPTQNGWIMVNWFSDIEYIKGESRFLVSFSKKLKPYLLELKNRFVSYNLKNILLLKSTYSIRIYQLLLEYKKIGARKYLVSDLQDILQVPKSLLRYSQFKQKVLEPTRKDIEKNTDIKFTYEEIKKNRKVDEVIFYIQTNKKILKKEIVKYEDIPKIIYNLMGIMGFKNDFTFYTLYADKSIRLEKEDGTYKHFKSLKQLTYKVERGLID